MKRTILRVSLGLLALVLLAVGALATTAQLRWDRTFSAPYPDLKASSDPAMIERGRYLAYGPAHCAYCHTTLDKMEALDRGEQPPLTGGHEFHLPFGTIRTPNLTPDPETGIGGRSDAEIARVLRHNVRTDRRALMPFMEFQNLSDEDIVALLSFLRSQEPVRNAVPANHYNMLGKTVMATMIKPSGPSSTPPRHSPPEGATVERGAYLVNTVANCAGCHTLRSHTDGSYLAPRLSGGNPMPKDDDPSMMLVPPNLTPDPKTGHIYDWSEDRFVARFRAGKQYEGSHMPWAPFGRTSDDDLRAIYRYLRTVEPAANATGPVLQSRADMEKKKS